MNDGWVESVLWRFTVAMSYLVGLNYHRWADSHVFRLVSTISKSTNINILILFELRWKMGHRSRERCQDYMRMYCLCLPVSWPGVESWTKRKPCLCDGSEGGAKDVCHDCSPGRKDGRSYRLFQWSNLVVPKRHHPSSSRLGWIDHRWTDAHVLRLVSTISKSINILILCVLRWKTGHRSRECCQDDMRMYCLYKIACVMTGHGVSVEEEALSMRWFRRWITRCVPWP